MKNENENDKDNKKLITMSCRIGLARAIAVPTTLMSSCSKQSPQTIKIMFNVTTNSVQILSYTLFENDIPTKTIIVSNKFANPTIMKQLKELENNGTCKFILKLPMLIN